MTHTDKVTMPAVDPNEPAMSHNHRWGAHLRGSVDALLQKANDRGHKIMSARITGDTIEAGREDEYEDRKAAFEKQEADEKLAAKREGLDCVARLADFTEQAARAEGIRDIEEESKATGTLARAASLLLCDARFLDGGPAGFAEDESSARRLLAQLREVVR